MRFRVEGELEVGGGVGEEDTPNSSDPAHTTPRVRVRATVEQRAGKWDGEAGARERSRGPGGCHCVRVCMCARSGFTTHTLACLCFRPGPGLDVGEVKSVSQVSPSVCCCLSVSQRPSMAHSASQAHKKVSTPMLPPQRVCGGTGVKKKLTRARFELAPLSRPRIVIKG